MSDEYKKITNHKALRTMNFADKLLGEVGTYLDEKGRTITRVAYIKDGKKLIAGICSENMNR